MPHSDPESALAELNSEGFVVLDSGLADLCDAAEAEFRAIEAASPELFKREADGRYPRLINFHLASPALRRLYVSNALALAVQDAFFGAKSSLYTTLFYEKGSGQDIHRDSPYFTTRPEHKYLGVWVPLEDVDEDNGPLMVMPKGHLLPEEDREAIRATLFEPDEVPDTSDELWVAYQDTVTRRGLEAGLTTRTVPVKKGQTIIWHPQLPHGGAPIKDPTRTRLSLVQHVTPEHYQVYGLDAFFNPTKPLPTEAAWNYGEDEDRLYINHGVVGIGHHVSVPTETLAIAGSAEPQRLTV
jgi:ectoine hydroxylase-related dioxygenase (phytanoyl-CoA dioxygenase family)